MEIQMETCHYCGSYTGDKKIYYKHTLYKKTSTIIPGASYNYTKTEVLVPRCQSCYDKHSKKFLYVELPIFIISFTGILYFFYNLNHGFKILLLVPSTILSLIITYILGKIFDGLFTELIFKVKVEDDIRKNKNIREYLRKGWKMNKSDLR